MNKLTGAFHPESNALGDATVTALARSGRDVAGSGAFLVLRLELHGATEEARAAVASVHAVVGAFRLIATDDAVVHFRIRCSNVKIYSSGRSENNKTSTSNF